MAEFYQLSTIQLAVLRQAASGATTVFAVLTPNPEIDAPEVLERLRREEKILMDFVELGLATDASADFESTIAKCRIDTKRSYRVLALTKAAKVMFDYCDDSECGNYHAPGDPSRRLPC